MCYACLYLFIITNYFYLLIVFWKTLLEQPIQIHFQMVFKWRSNWVHIQNLVHTFDLVRLTLPPTAWCTRTRASATRTRTSSVSGWSMRRITRASPSLKSSSCPLIASCRRSTGMCRSPSFRLGDAYICVG